MIDEYALDSQRLVCSYQLNLKAKIIAMFSAHIFWATIFTKHQCAARFENN